MLALKRSLSSVFSEMIADVASFIIGFVAVWKETPVAFIKFVLTHVTFLLLQDLVPMQWNSQRVLVVLVVLVAAVIIVIAELIQTSFHSLNKALVFFHLDTTQMSVE